MDPQESTQGILILNPGSSSLKWALFTGPEASHASISGKSSPGASADEIGTVLKKYPAQVAILRFVHGGHDFVDPVEIDKHRLEQLQGLESLAPLHNNNSLLCSRQVAEHAPGMRQIAVFDTAFFHDLPRVSRSYGLPRTLVEKYGIRRFGFHGFAHHGMLRAWHELNPGKNAPPRLVTAQLGSGCSMAAIRDGRPIDTTMGFTPNEGLLMSTRCGDIDPGLVTWLQRREGWGADMTDKVLNEQSGWLGVSGESADMGELLRSDSAEAGWATDLFIHRIRKTLGAYHALLGGLDGVIFSGGIAEHNPDFCKEIVTGLGHLGIHPATAEPGPALVDVTGLEARRLTAPDSPTACWCVEGDEHRSMLESACRIM